MTKPKYENTEETKYLTIVKNIYDKLKPNTNKTKI